MTDDRPITPEQALLAVKAAGLDPDQSLSEQLNMPGQLEERTVKRWVNEAISEVAAAAGQSATGQPADPQSQERRFAEGYRDALNRSMTPWMGEEHEDVA